MGSNIYHDWDGPVDLGPPKDVPAAGNFVRFYGESDDLIEVDGAIPGCDEYPAEDATFEVAGLRVRVLFARRGWEITVGQIDENVPVTAADVMLDVAPNGYSMRLALSVPDGSHVTRVAREVSGDGA